MILDILKVPDCRLKTACEAVLDSDMPGLEPLINDLFETMYANDGLGLAAPQVGILKRVFVMDVRETKKPHNPVAFINPEILVKRGESVGEEGCLSVPDLFLDIHRAYKICVAAHMLDASAFFLTFHGLEARVIQHETDHLDGILFTDRAMEYAAAASK